MSKKLNGTDIDKNRMVAELEKLRNEVYQKITKLCLGRDQLESDSDRFVVNFYPDEGKRVFLFDGNAIGEIVDVIPEEIDEDSVFEVIFKPYNK